MADKSIGFIETFGLAAAVAAADAAVKSANVKLLGYEYTKGDGMCTVKVEGNVGAVKAAIEAGKKTAEMVNGPLSGTKSVVLMARPAEGIKDILIYNKENVGGEIALAAGKRPAGTGHKPVLVKNWKPKEEAKAAKPEEETPTEEAPEPPVVEDLKEESKPAVTQPEIPVEETVEEKTEAPIAEETPVTEEVPEAEEPVLEEKPEVEEPAKEEIPEAEEPAKEESKTEEPAEGAAETPKKTTSTGNRRSRSRRKKNTDKTDS